MSTVTIDVSELPARLAEALALAKAGTEVLVTDAGGRRARLTPADPPQAPPAAGKREWVMGLHAGLIHMREDFDDYIDEDAFLRGDI